MQPSTTSDASTKEGHSSRTPPTLAVLLTLLLVLVSFSISQSLWRGVQSTPQAEPRAITPRGDLAADEQATIELFQRMSKSVVSIATSTIHHGPGFDPIEVPRGTGTGFVWDQHGHIVTNFHVLEDGQTCRVTLADQSIWNAEVVGTAQDHDLAVLRIAAPAERLQPVIVGTSRDLQVGQRVFAIGSPFGLDQTLTTGIISGLGREIKSRSERVILGVIQTDAAINPGNSGGPLLDSAGRLIGVNTAIYSPTGASAGIGFAIPVDMVNRTVPRVIKYGRAVRPLLGVRVTPDSVMQKMGMRGVMVMEVQSDNARAAGIQGLEIDRETVTRLGDIIVEFDNREILRQDDLFAALEECEGGQEVALTVIRDARSNDPKKLKLRVKLLDVLR
ncbi:MAG: trypsin-like peptidase domain-containing protein [Pirellulales bacterium]